MKMHKVKEYTPIRVIRKLPNSEQSYKGKVKTHKYINRQNQSTFSFTSSYFLSGNFKLFKHHADF
jgi:hypothetical protein